MSRNLNLAALLILCIGATAPLASAEDPVAKPTVMELEDGKVVLTAPKEWKKSDKRSQMIQFEFSAPAEAKEDEPSVRITVMRAGGSIDANIDRWYGQFTQPDGKSTKEQSKVEKFEAEGQTVHWVDIPGTFKETMGGGPFSGGKTVEREDYRMLGAILVAESGAQYFIKMTGPTKICESLKDGFEKMLKEVQVKK